MAKDGDGPEGWHSSSGLPEHMVPTACWQIHSRNMVDGRAAVFDLRRTTLVAAPSGITEDHGEQAMTDDPTIRVAFEKWYSDDWQTPKAVERDGKGGYKLMGAETAWQAWMADLARDVPALRGVSRGSAKKKATKAKTPEPVAMPRFQVVGGTGIEPVTPTMSRSRKSNGNKTLRNR